MTSMTEEEVQEARRRHADRERMGGGICETCGFYGVNVVHDPPEYRAWQNEHVYHMDYYVWAGVEFHPFVGAKR